MSDCLFCKIIAGEIKGSAVHENKDLVAIKDINPKAPVHLLVIPERHVDSFREIGEFSNRETKRMMEFIAEVARDVGLRDYQVTTNVGAAAGQTIFHLHWHILGRRHVHAAGRPETTAVTEL